MKVFIESSALLAERTGIGQFTKRLIEAYHKEYPDQKLVLFGFRLFYRKFTAPIKADSKLSYQLIRWFPGRIYTGLFKNGVNLPIDTLAGIGRKDVIIFPNFIRWPSLLNRRSLAFIHDMSFIFYGQYSSPPNREYMLKFVPQTIAKSNHIITISESSKRDIAGHFKIPLESISIVYPFIDMNEFKRTNEKEADRVRNKLKLPKKYLLFMSTIEPRKNIKGLVEAYKNLDKNISDEYALVLAGGKGWLNDDIHKEIDSLNEQGFNIIRTGYVDDEDLPGLYSGASLYVFIPHYEGFGISPLEAMACGVPVITSNNSSLPEVVGKAGKLVDANEPLQTTKAISYLLKHPDIRKRMVKEGYRQAAKFNPGSAARQLQAAIEKVS